MPSISMLSERRRLHRSILWLQLLAACSTGPVDVPHGSTAGGVDVPDPPTWIELSVPSLIVWAEGQDTVRVRAFDAAGREVPAPAVRWYSDDSLVATVDTLGVVAGIAEGRTRVTAASGGLSASVAVEVLGVALVELQGPSTLLVNDIAVLEVTARSSGGQAIRNPSWAKFSSSDSSLLQVGASGTVRGLRRGSASIAVRVADASAAITLHVGARFKLTPAYPLVGMTVGETLRLSATYVDANGAEIPEMPAVSWRSNNPAVVTVSPDGLVTSDGLVTATAAAQARIYAATEADTLFRDVSANDFRPGQPTTIRYVHATRGVGPIRFASSSGDSVTLSYGESAVRTVPPGDYDIRAEEMPATESEWGRWHIRNGDHLSVYAVFEPRGTPPWRLVPLWSRQQNIPAEWGTLRVLQGSTFLTYFLGTSGESPGDLPEECYFDPGNLHALWEPMAPGRYEIILTTKYPYGPQPPIEIARVSLDILPGQAATAVLTGSRTDDAGALIFLDP